MAKITPHKNKDTIVVKTMADKKIAGQAHKWWKAASKAQLGQQVLETATFLKETQQYRYRQASIYSRMYSNQTIFNVAGSTISRPAATNNMPIDRPTMNVVQSCIDTLVSRLSQEKPRPVFLTDNSDYKERNFAKQMNTFINGELYQTKAYELAPIILRDAAVLGTGCLKIFETEDKKVGLERKLYTELLVDPNDALYGDPRQLFEMKLIDKSVLAELFPDSKSMINNSEQAFPDMGVDSSKTISDQIIVVEAWHLPSGDEAGDGRHCIVCSEGVILDEEYTKKRFPFVFLHYSPRLTGFWGQGLAEQIMGTQIEINKLLMTASASINIMAVPRVWIEDGSKIAKTHLNNQIGAIGTFRGREPLFMQGTTGLTPDFYAHLDRLIQYAYQQSGISTLSATAQKPAGLNSGEAIRNYDDLQSDRFASLSRRYHDIFPELAYQITDFAKDIIDETGSYETIYPNKNGVKQIKLTDYDKLCDPFVYQCFDSSSLPRDPAGRLQKITEMMQAGLISPQEGRRLLDYPDIEQNEKLANAGEERILQILDEIVEEGKYTPPDPFMDIQLATQLCTEYYNLYSSANLEEEKSQMLRDFFTQLGMLTQASQPPQSAPGQPQASPQAPPVSDMIPNVPGAQSPQQ